MAKKTTCEDGGDPDSLICEVDSDKEWKTKPDTVLHGSWRKTHKKIKPKEKKAKNPVVNLKGDVDDIDRQVTCADCGTQHTSKFCIKCAMKKT